MVRTKSSRRAQTRKKKKPTFDSTFSPLSSNKSSHEENDVEGSDVWRNLDFFINGAYLLISFSKEINYELRRRYNFFSSVFCYVSTCINDGLWTLLRSWTYSFLLSNYQEPTGIQSFITLHAFPPKLLYNLNSFNIWHGICFSCSTKYYFYTSASLSPSTFQSFSPCDLTPPFISFHLIFYSW